jgi:enoyl-CoA hydratase/carnithine racemase
VPRQGTRSPKKWSVSSARSAANSAPNEALQIGLVSRVVGPNELDGTVGGTRRTLRSRDRRVVLACKRYLRAVGKMPSEARSAYALVEHTQFDMAILNRAES